MSGFDLALNLQVKNVNLNFLVQINRPHSPTGDVFKFMNHSEQKLSLLKKKDITVFPSSPSHTQMLSESDYSV